MTEAGMTETKFTELVNLYLDKEISEQGLAELKAELVNNAERKAEFAERCRFHQAMRLALNPAALDSAVAKQRRSSSKRSSSSSSSSSSKRARASSSRSSLLNATSPAGSGRSRSSRSVPTGSPRSSGSNRSTSSNRVSRVDEFSQGATHFPRWLMGAGLAACFALGFTLLKPVFRDTTAAASQPAFVGVDADELVEQDPLDTIGRADLRRFAAIQAQREANHRASIAAQLRLMGLRPEFTPTEKQLRSVSVAAVHSPQPIRNDAELLAGLQKLTAMPAQQILRAESLQAEPAIGWPGGFHSSLASFK